MEKKNEDNVNVNANLESDSEDDKDNTDERSIKLVLIGDGCSGKTSICNQLCKKKFSKKYTQTYGVDFYSKKITLPNNIEVLLQIWDIGGQSVASPLLEKYLYGVQGVLLIYDVTNSTSFANLQDWITVTKKITKNYEKHVHMSLVGNKTDLEHRRAVRVEKHTKLAEQYGMSSHYVSAKTGDSVALAFRQTAADIFGIQLSKIDMESDITIVQAPVAVPTEKELKEVAAKNALANQNNSAACRIQ
ncbi:Ras-related protein Rab-28 [Strongyloides ratti]|uniref:Ras-related protein Rab-28 n=1 Tax=Strongyloides ratti TaxID=34506 RepID=A0A090LT53_STRRB|nr:Ras-related protein Rab-28 [Strongyloides ratti]CEF71397.1 Ras-related protein Rab-28 [Strongyloides ratti]